MGEGIFALAASIIGGLIVLAGHAYFNRRRNDAVRQQIIFLLRSVSVQMAMSRDYPQVRLMGFDSQLERLTERILSTEGTLCLNNEQRTAVLDAISETEQSSRYIETDYERFIKDQAEYDDLVNEVKGVISDLIRQISFQQQFGRGVRPDIIGIWSKKAVDIVLKRTGTTIENK